MRLAFVGFLTLAAMASASAQDGRTLVDKMALDTPEQAVQSLIDAFSAEDYLSVYFMLTPEAKDDFAMGYATFNVGQYFILRETGWIDGSFHSPMDAQDDQRVVDLRNDIALIFDDLMFHATANSQMPFRLAGGVIQNSTEIEDGMVAVAIDAGGAEVTVETREIYNGDWRIDRIAWPGSAPEGRPWSIGTKAKSKS